MNSLRVDALQVLPVELWVQVAESGTPGVWLNLCCAVAPLGRWSLYQDIQLKMMDKFVNESNGEYRLPNGKLHSYRNRSAKKEYYKDGTLWREYWYSFGEIHREPKAAVKEYYKDGTLSLEEWWQNGNYVTGIEHLFMTLFRVVMKELKQDVGVLGLHGGVII